MEAMPPWHHHEFRKSVPWAAKLEKVSPSYHEGSVRPFTAQRIKRHLGQVLLGSRLLGFSRSDKKVHVPFKECNFSFSPASYHYCILALLSFKLKNKKISTLYGKRGEKKTFLSSQ